MYFLLYLYSYHHMYPVYYSGGCHLNHNDMLRYHHSLFWLGPVNKHIPEIAEQPMLKYNPLSLSSISSTHTYMRTCSIIDTDIAVKLSKHVIDIKKSLKLAHCYKMDSIQLFIQIKHYTIIKLNLQYFARMRILHEHRLEKI